MGSFGNVVMDQQPWAIRVALRNFMVLAVLPLYMIAPLRPVQSAPCNASDGTFYRECTSNGYCSHPDHFYQEQRKYPLKLN